MAIAIIPARYGSTRFPGKPLARETGKFLIEHVVEAAAGASSLSRVIVSTDDDRIREAVVSFGGEVVMTRADHETGTSRVAEAAQKVGVRPDDIVLNVQGDEPELCPGVLDELVSAMEGSAGVGIGTIACPFDADGPKSGVASPLDPNCVKVVLSDAGRALYFSRSLIPYPRGRGGEVDDPSKYLLHLGVYAFRGSALQELADLHVESRLDEVESLEQLRWLAAGREILVRRVGSKSHGVDTQEQYAAFVERHKQRLAAAGAT